MADEHSNIPIPETGNRPNYFAIPRGSGPSPAEYERLVDNAVKDGFPADDPSNPTLSKLRKIVRNGMLASGCAPGLYAVMGEMSLAIRNDPRLASGALVNSLTDATLKNKDGAAVCLFSGFRLLETIVDVRPDLADAVLVRNMIQATIQGATKNRSTDESLAVLEKIAEKRPELLNADVAKIATQSATHDPDLIAHLLPVTSEQFRVPKPMGVVDSSDRLAANKVLAKLAETRPDLVNADMVRVVSQTAKEPIADHNQDQVGDVLSPKPGLMTILAMDGSSVLGIQRDTDDNASRSLAQQTLKTIEEKRPDLMVTSKPLTVKQDSTLQPVSHAGPCVSVVP